MIVPTPHRNRSEAVRPAGRGPAGGYPTLRRDPENGHLGGLCQAIATRQGIDPLLVRALAVVLALSSGLGVGLYLALWSVTPAAESRGVPLDRVLPSWRRWGSAGTGLYIGAVTAAFVLVIGQVTPFGWWPALVLAASWALVKGLAGHGPRRVRIIARAHRPSAGDRRQLRILSWVTLAGALLVGPAVGWAVPRWTTLSPLVCGACAALLVVGGGLLLGARWGLSRVLRNIGIALGLVTLVLDTPYLIAASGRSEPTSYRFASADSLPGEPLVLRDTEATVDLSALAGEGSGSITVEAVNSIVHVTAPGNRPVRIDYECQLAQVRAPGRHGCKGMGTGLWTNGDQNGPALEMHVRARASDVQVIS